MLSQDGQGPGPDLASCLAEPWKCRPRVGPLAVTIMREGHEGRTGGGRSEQRPHRGFYAAVNTSISVLHHFGASVAHVKCLVVSIAYHAASPNCPIA